MTAGGVVAVVGILAALAGAMIRWRRSRRRGRVKILELDPRAARPAPDEAP